MKIMPIFFNSYNKPVLNSKRYHYQTIPYDKVEFRGENPQNNLTMQNLTCLEEDFKVKNIKNLNCPICNKLMLNGNQIQEFIENIRYKTGDKLVKALCKYEADSIYTNNTSQNPKSIFRGKKQEIVEEIKKLALQYPNFSIKDIVKIKGINCLKSLIEQQLNVVDKLEEYLIETDITEEEYDKIEEIISRYKNQIQDMYGGRFLRQDFIIELSKVTSNKEAQEKIIEIISKLPKSDNNTDSFFVKYSSDKYTEEEIIGALVNNTIPTAEHLKPKSKNGKNSLANYICDCEECNSKRKNMDFKNWIKQIPDAEKNLQDYIDTVQKNIEDETLDSSYYQYIPSVIDTISELSDGEIRLKKPVLKSGEITKRENIIAKIKNKANSLRSEINDLEQEVVSIKEYGFYYEIQEIKKLQEEKMEETKSKIERLERELNSINTFESLRGNLAAHYIKLGKAMQEDENTDILIKEIENLKEKIKNYDGNTTKCQIETLKQQILDAKKEFDNIKENEYAHPREKELLEQEKIYSKRISQIDSLIKEINECKILAMKLYELQKQIDDLNNQNSILEQQNKKIQDGLNENISEDNFKEYENLHILLKDAHIKIAEKKNSKKAKSTCILLEMAKKYIINEIAELETKPEVQYYINEKEIKSNELVIKNLMTKMDSIENTLKNLDDKEKELANILSGKSAEDIQEQYLQIKKELKIITGTKNIQKKEERLQSLKSKLALLEAALIQTTNYKNIPKNKFNSIVDSISKIIE